MNRRTMMIAAALLTLTGLGAAAGVYVGHTQSQSGTRISRTTRQDGSTPWAIPIRAPAPILVGA